MEDVAKDYPDVTLEHMLVDNCAMQIVHNPCQFDVVLTENMFGDILPMRQVWWQVPSECFFRQFE